MRLRFRPVTRKGLMNKEEKQRIDTLRHSCAHLLAMAVQDIFPQAQVAIGPVIEDGFYYDFGFDRPFTPEDLKDIESRMRKISRQNLPIQKKVVPRSEAIRFFKEKGEHLKVEIISQIPDGEEVSIYEQGNFSDLCRGPHVKSTGEIKHFNLTKVSGAYWRGDSKNQMLQRIYGTCWLTDEELKSYLKRQEEAKKRDHRKLGPELDLFHFQELAPGSVFWHPKGWTLFQNLIAYLRHEQEQTGYVEVNTPDVMDRSLWETSGHWQNYRQNMFTTTTEDERVFALKPMNCPGAVSLFGHGLKSYRQLPLRMAEFGKVHRYEPSGSLHGLMRVRHFTQDDAHIFCTNRQMQSECAEVIRLVLKITSHFGFEDVAIKLSTRPENRIGSDETWDILESSLTNALDEMKIPYGVNEGEGAFYGPKLEFVLRDAIGREWQCGTLQVDLNLPERFDLWYINEAGEKERPVMLHRALFGSLERFIGILVEHYAGKFPAWLSPLQAAVLNISEHQSAYVDDVVFALRKAGIRAEGDTSSEKISHKIRTQTLQKTPFLLIVGDREKQDKTISVRARSGEMLGTFPLSEIGSVIKEMSNDSTTDGEPPCPSYS